MKNFLVLVLLLLSVFGLNAQEEELRNNFVIGGSANFAIQNGSVPFSTIGLLPTVGTIGSFSLYDKRNVLAAFSPYIGKQLNEKLLLGINLNVNLRKSEGEQPDFFGSGADIPFERNSNLFGVGVFTRYVFNPQNKIMFFIEPSISYSNQNDKYFVDGELGIEEKTRLLSAAVRAGLLYDLNEKIRFTLRQGGLSFTRGSWETDGVDLVNDFQSFNANFRLSSISLGVEWKF